MRVAILAKIGPLVLDASLRESHHLPNEVTEHPVEKGANVADHIRQKPDEITIEGLVSSAPIDQRDREKPDAGERAQNAHLRLRQLRAAGELLTVVTALRTYTNMAILDLVLPRDASTGEAVQFTIQLREVRIVESKTVALVETKTDRGKPPAKKGKQPTKPAEEATVNKSILKKGWDSEFVRGLRKEFTGITTVVK